MTTSAKAGFNVGLMIPGNNTTMERELLAWLPAGSTCTTLRIPRGKGLLTPETMPAYKAQAIALAAAFSDTDIDVVAYGCTAAGFIAGPAGEAELAAQISEATGKVVVTTARSAPAPGHSPPGVGNAASRFVPTNAAPPSTRTQAVLSLA